MKKSTEVVAKKENIVWSWLLRASTMLFPHAPTLVAISLKRFFKLPDPVVREIISYFSLSERANLLMFKPNNRLFIAQKDLLAELNDEQSVDAFIHLMTLDSPDIQDEARAMLTQHPHLAVKLMFQAREMHENAAARQFSQPISAYEYAWCIDDKPMCQMLEQHMSGGINANVLRRRDARAVEKFMYLITREGEDNQNKAEAMLKQYPHLVGMLISAQTDTRDTVRHFIKPMSAYEYAYWAGDTRMRTMLNKYIDQDESLKATVNAQCKNIVEHGIEFEMISSHGKPVPNSTVSYSKYFDYQSLEDAYDAYNAEASRLITGRKFSSEDWKDAEALWLKVGIEWAKAPVSGMQEICSSHPFSPLQDYQATLTNTSLVRTVKFYNWVSGNDEYLVSRGIVNANLGGVFSILKGVGEDVWGLRTKSGFLRSGGGLLDSAAVAAMCKVRTDDDLKQTLVDLKPAEPRSRLSL